MKREFQFWLTKQIKKVGISPQLKVSNADKREGKYYSRSLMNKEGETLAR